jgi:hypothetical protein
MVFHSYRKPFDAAFKRWPFRDRPRLQNTVQLKAEVKVMMRSPMLVDNKGWQLLAPTPVLGIGAVKHAHQSFMGYCKKHDNQGACLSFSDIMEIPPISAWS